MRFKKDMDTLMHTVRTNVHNEVKRAFVAPTTNYYYGQEVKFDMNDIIASAIAKGVAEGLRTLIDEEYTDEDFERDIGLTK